MGITKQRTCVLESSDERDAVAFLAASASRNVYLRWRIEQGVLTQSSKHEQMLGARNGKTGELEALLGVGANLVPAGKNEDALVELGSIAATSDISSRMLIGPEEGVNAIWRGFRGSNNPAIHLDTIHIYYEVTPDSLFEQLHLPGLRLAAMSDLVDVEEASAQMLFDDLGRTDRDDNAGLFRRRMRHAISQNEVFVAREAGRLVFKVNFGARTDDTVQLQGVFTAREARQRGIGRAGCAEICRRLFEEGVSVVNLFVREENVAARRAYEAAGFVASGRFRMIILETSTDGPS